MNTSWTAHDAILRSQEQFWQALQTKDAALLSALLAPQFVGRSPGEPDQTRDEFIATLLAFPGPISEIAGEGIEVHAFALVQDL